MLLLLAVPFTSVDGRREEAESPGSSSAPARSLQETGGGIVLFPPVRVEAELSTGPDEGVNQSGGMLLFPPVAVDPLPTSAPSSRVDDIVGGMLLFPPVFVDPPNISLAGQAAAGAVSSSSGSSGSVSVSSSTAVPTTTSTSTAAPTTTTTSSSEELSAAVVSSSSTNVTALQVTGVDQDVVFGDWWHWFLLVLLFVLLAMAFAIIWHCVSLQRRKAEKAEDEVVPFNKAVLPESDDEHPVTPLDDSSPPGLKVAPVSSQDSLKVDDPSSRSPKCDVQFIESPALSADQRAASPADKFPAEPVLAATRPADVQAQPDAVEISRAADTPLVRALPPPALGNERFQPHPREEASQFLRAALEDDSMDLLQKAIARAKAADVPEEEVWFAEVCRRRRLAVEVLLVLLAVERDVETSASCRPALAPQWRRLWTKKASAMRDLLARAKTNPQAVLNELRSEAEDLSEPWHYPQPALPTIG